MCLPFVQNATCILDRDIWQPQAIPSSLLTKYAQAVLPRGFRTTQSNTILIAIIQEARCSNQQWLLQQALQLPNQA